MLSFRSILFATAAFATVVSAVPTLAPDVDRSLVQRTPFLGELLGGLPLVGGLLGWHDEGNTRGGSSCGELINKCHDDIVVIAVKIC